MKKKLILSVVPALIGLCALVGCGEDGGNKNPVVPDTGEFDVAKATITGISAEVTAELGTRYTIPVPVVEYNGSKREVSFEVLDSENNAVELVARGTRFYVESVNDYKINYYITYLGESKLVASSDVTVTDTKGPEIILPASAYSMTVYKDSAVKIPVPTVRDGSGVVASQEVKVTFKGQPVEIVKGAEGEADTFVPTNYGEYIIEYTAKDGSDNTTVEPVTVNCARMITLCDFENTEIAQAGNSSLTTEHAFSGNALKIENDAGLWIALKVYPAYYNLSGFDRLQMNVWVSRDITSGAEGFYLLNQKYYLQEGDNILTIDKEALTSQYPNGLIPSSNPNYAGADYLWFQPYGQGVTFIVDNLVGIFDSFEEDTVAPTIDFGRDLQLELTKNEGVLYVNEERPVVVPTAGLKAYDNSMEALNAIDYTVKVKDGADITAAVKAGTYNAVMGEVYQVTYSVTDGSGNTGTRTLNIHARAIELPAGNDLPADRTYDILQDFETVSAVNSSDGFTSDCGDLYAREGAAVMIAPVSAAKTEFKVKLLKNGSPLTVQDFEAYQYFQLSVVSNADDVVLSLGGRDVTLKYGLNLIQLWGSEFLAQIKAGAYDAEGWLTCSVKGAECKLYLDNMIGVKAEENPEEPDYLYTVLQSFDVKTNLFGNAGCTIDGTSREHAVKDFAMKLTINPGTATFLMPLLKDGKPMKEYQLEGFDYVEFKVYSDKADVGIYFFKTRVATLTQGENTVRIEGDDFVDIIKNDDGTWFPAYNFANGQSAWQIGSASGATVYFDHFIGVYPDGYVEPEEPVEPEKPWELPDEKLYYDELQTFDAADCVSASGGAQIEITTDHAVKGNMVKVTPASSAGFTLTIAFKKNGELLTDWDLKNYDYLQFSVYSEAACTMFFFGQRVNLLEGKNTVKFSGATLAALIGAQYNANGVTACWMDGITAEKAIYLDHMIGVYPADYDPENPPVRPVEPEEPEEPDEPVISDPYATLVYDMLQSFDEDGAVKGVGTFELSTDHAVTGNTVKWTVGGPAWAGFQIVLKKDGVALTAEDIAAYQYVQFVIYSESDETAGLWTLTAKLTDIVKGKNVVQIPAAAFLTAINASSAGEIGLQMVTPSNNTFVYYFEDFIAVKDVKFADLPEDLDYDVLQSFETAETAEVQKTDAESGELIDEFQACTVTTEHTAKDNAVTFSTTKASQKFRVKLTKQDGTAYTAEELAEYDELWLHLYYVKVDSSKKNANFSIGDYEIAKGIEEGVHVIKINVEQLLEVLDSVYADGWLTVKVTNGAQKYVITIDELLGVRAAETAPTDPVTPDQPAEPTD